MQELNPKQILETISELEKQSDRLCELLPEEILLEMNTTVAIALSGLRQISFDIDHGLILNVGAILKLREMLDEQEAKT